MHKLFEHQLEAVEIAKQSSNQRICLYYRTGSGKTLTSLLCMQAWNQDDVLVLAPPSTHNHWKKTAETLGITVDTISHAKFRMSHYKLSKTKALIVDEMHLLGGYKAAGWKKLNLLSRHLSAPIVLASATPNYNDADRVYCIEKILHPAKSKGYLSFLYENCKLEMNPFSQTPDVTGFLEYPDAAAYLADMRNVAYLPDNVEYEIDEVSYSFELEPAFHNYGLLSRTNRLAASQIEKEHARIIYSTIDRAGYLHKPLSDLVEQHINGPTLIFCNHSSIAEAAQRSLATKGYTTVLVTGKTTAAVKQRNLDAFRDGDVKALIGTASLATGTDGLDKVCNTLIILDDTQDDSLRRQLIGRILPRGEDSDASQKQIHRFNILS